MPKKSRKNDEIQVPTTRRSTRSKTRHTISTERISGNENGSAIAIMAEMPKLGRSNGKELFVAPEQRSQWMYRSIEENLLTLLEHSENADPEEILEDKIMFVEATNALCVIPNLAQVPTQKMLQAVLEFIQECSSVGLTASSFNLLADLEKRHPRVRVKESTSPDSGRKLAELIIDEKVWSPLEETCQELVRPDRQLVPSSPTRVSSNIFILLEEIVRRVQQEGGVESGKDVVILSQFSMLQHLMRLLQTDLQCRLEVFDSDAEKDYTLVQGSYLCRLIFGLTQAEKKSFIMSLKSIMCPSTLETDDSMLEDGRRVRRVCSKSLRRVREESTFQDGTGKTSDSVEKNSKGRKVLLPATREFGRLASDILVLIVKVDTLNQMYGLRAAACNSRRDRLLFETLLNLCREASTLDAYLKAVADPTAKLKFVMDYFLNFAPQPVVRSLGDFPLIEFLEKLLSYLSEKKALKSVVKVFKEADSLPLLLSHAFQAYLLLHSLGENSTNDQGKNDAQENRVRICKFLVAALINLEDLEGPNITLPTVKQTVFVAKRISGF
ncbi:hypothetical protein R1flu_004491 [Riccia fluitans]|uniref:Uncharacterized protein n=1 Tax=Riccia fluitans TaxID=41844 RepID=A0ABD1YTH1_9MARC